MIAESRPAPTRSPPVCPVPVCVSCESNVEASAALAWHPREDSKAGWTARRAVVRNISGASGPCTRRLPSRVVRCTSVPLLRALHSHAVMHMTALSSCSGDRRGGPPRTTERAPSHPSAAQSTPPMRPSPARPPAPTSRRGSLPCVHPRRDEAAY